MEAGNVDAQLTLGMSYLLGNSTATPRNLTQAIELFERGAASRHPSSQWVGWEGGVRVQT